MTAVTVTAEHIAKGWRGDCRFCPVALAIADALPGLAYLAVSYPDVDVRPSPEEDMITIGLPADAVAFIRAFDTGAPAEPFTFELDYPAVTP